MRRFCYSSNGAAPAHDGLKTALRTARGMTLMELILVMALLATVLAFSAPAFSRFIRGRDLGEETRRFLALTRHARSEAASRGVQMELWLDVETGFYGLAPVGLPESEERQRREWRLADGLRFEVDINRLDETGRGMILFWPDGSIDEASLEELGIVEVHDADKRIQIARDVVGTGYFVRDRDAEDV